VLQGEEELDQNERKKLRKLKAVEESDDEEEGKEGHGASLSRFFIVLGRRRFIDGKLLQNYFVCSFLLFFLEAIDPLCI